MSSANSEEESFPRRISFQVPNSPNPQVRAILQAIETICLSFERIVCHLTDSNSAYEDFQTSRARTPWWQQHRESSNSSGITRMDFQGDVPMDN